MSVSAKMISLQELEEYYRQHFEIASLPIAQRPINSDLLTRTEREIMDCTTRIDQALGLPTIMDVKPERTFKRGFNINSLFNDVTKIFSVDIFLLKRFYNSLIQLIFTFYNFVWDIGLTLYGPSICSIIEVFFGDGSTLHLFLLCVVVSICILIHIFFNCPPVYVILSGFPVLWQVALTISPTSENYSIPTFIERLPYISTHEKKTPKVVER